MSVICGISVLSSVFSVRPARSLGLINIETICHNFVNENDFNKWVDSNVEVDERKHIIFPHFFLRRNFLCASNSGLPYSFSEMVNICMTVLEYHNFSCRHWDRNVVFYKRKLFASLIPFFPFFRKKILCISNPGFPYSFSERVWFVMV